MPLHRIDDPTLAGTGTPVVADRPLYTNADGTKLLEEGDKDATTLVVSHAGKVIPAEYVASLGLEAGDGGKVKQRAAGGDKERVTRRDKGAPDTHEATPPKDDGRTADPVVAAGAGVFETLDGKALKALAKERGVPGYAKLNDAELRAALAEGGAMQAGGTTAG